MAASKIPKYGLKIKLNHVYPEKKKQEVDTPLRQIVQLAPLILRYARYYTFMKISGRNPFIDHLKLKNSLQIYGCPIGGIGGGTIGRGYRGEFCRFQLRPGLYEYRTAEENQFIVSIRNEMDVNIFQSVLSTYKTGKSSSNDWQWNIDSSKCNYTGLYPRAWTEYDLSEYGIKLICRQISPIIPHNYKDSSLPCAVFVWEVINVCEDIRSVSIAFTWKESYKTISNKFRRFSDARAFGVTMEEKIGDMSCSFTVAKTKQFADETNDGACTFNVYSDCKRVWQNFQNHAKLIQVDSISNKQKHNAMGVSGEVILSPASVGTLEFSLAWDMPNVKFQNETRTWQRFYTRYFGAEGAAGPAMASYALNNYEKWEEDIYEWQSPVLDNSELPDWYKGALMNELYYVADGGTVWFDVGERYPTDDPRSSWGLFGYLEGHEYRMYNSYDVHFYASFALAMLWPNLQVTLQYDIKDAIPAETDTFRTLLYSSGEVRRKVANTVPHDMGDPDEEPFLVINAYNVHDVSEWRDLNPKFILQVFRDYVLLKQFGVDARTNNAYDAHSYLKDMYPACKTLIDIMKTWDKDNDGLIENSGFPDQTFDAWVMTGPSAYCGGLWLGALRVMISISKILGHYRDVEEYEILLEKGQKSFDEKLWTGDYYKFDSDPENKNIIMADQLCGQWYLRSCGFTHEVFPKEKVGRALDVIYRNNVKRFYNGKLGAINGYVMGRDDKEGRVDKTSIASGESWTGITYGLSSLMLFEGKVGAAFDTAGSMHNTMSRTFGMSFETPEAFNDKGNYRSIGYMRPLSIWAMQHAVNSIEKL